MERKGAIFSVEPQADSMGASLTTGSLHQVVGSGGALPPPAPAGARRLRLFGEHARPPEADDHGQDAERCGRSLARGADDGQGAQTKVEKERREFSQSSSTHTLSLT